MNNNSVKDKMLSANLIAQYFIWKAQKEKKELTNKKLQKLLYYSQAWNLVFEKKPLFEENIEAWVHGPAVRDVYFKYKEYGFSPIAEKGQDVEDSKLKKFLNEIWRVYGKFDGDYLETLTHNEEPWREARKNLEDCEPSTRIIDNEIMRKFYSRRLNQAKKTNG